MSKSEMIEWLQNLREDIGQLNHQDLWHYAEMLDEAINVIESLPTIDIVTCKECRRCRWFVTDKCRECFGNELFEDSRYVTQTNCVAKMKGADK